MRASFHRVLFAGSLFAVAFSTGTGCNRSAERDEPARCPVVPLSLVMEAPGKRPVEILAVDGRGILRGGFTGAKRKLARLDQRGCLIGDDGVWVELTPAGDLWTLRQVFAIEQDQLRLGEKRIRIAPDGEIVFTGPDGSPQKNPYATIRIARYRPEAACAGRILFVTYLSMMPSMAVVDGTPRTLPPPENSLCR